MSHGVDISLAGNGNNKYSCLLKDDKEVNAVMQQQLADL